MAVSDTLRSLGEIDFADLDLNSIGSWPMPVKVVVWSFTFAAIVGGGYYFILSAQSDLLAQERGKEVELKKKYERRSAEAANLDAYRQQMVEIERNFGVLLSQLPEDTEVPGLLDDISTVGVSNGLTLDFIGLKAEIHNDFYVELPITIEASGDYHDFGAFVSGVATLPRIVTLHDCSIKRVRGRPGEDDSLALEVMAKTYRYKEG